MSEEANSFFNSILDLIKKLNNSEMILENIEAEFSELEFEPVPQRFIPYPAAVPQIKKPTEILKTEFTPPIQIYPGRVVEVKIGATKKEGGTRDKTVVVGGETSPAFYTFESPTPHPPVVSLDVFDTKIPMAKAVKNNWRDVLDDPAEWAKKAVNKFGAEMINLHMESIDPLRENTSPSEAAKTVEEVLQAVKVPLTVGGCGDPVKDLQVFEKVAEAAEGERILINSVTLDMDLEKAAKAIKEHGHVVIAFTSMDMQQQKELDRKLYEYLPKENIIMDTTTAALGYGLDYAFTIMERTRLAALMGDEELQHPLSSGTTNAWAAREAWIKLGPEWEPRELRGPIWEVVTALTLLLAGVDLFMMMHPKAVETVKSVIQRLVEQKPVKPQEVINWVTKKF